MMTISSYNHKTKITKKYLKSTCFRFDLLTSCRRQQTKRMSIKMKREAATTKINMPLRKELDLKYSLNGEKQNKTKQNCDIL